MNVCFNSFAQAVDGFTHLCKQLHMTTSIALIVNMLLIVALLVYTSSQKRLRTVRSMLVVYASACMNLEYMLASFISVRSAEQFHDQQGSLHQASSELKLSLARQWLATSKAILVHTICIEIMTLLVKQSQQSMVRCTLNSLKRLFFYLIYVSTIPVMIVLGSIKIIFSRLYDMPACFLIDVVTISAMFVIELTVICTHCLVLVLLHRSRHRHRLVRPKLIKRNLQTKMLLLHASLLWSIVELLLSGLVERNHKWVTVPVISVSSTLSLMAMMIMVCEWSFYTCRGSIRSLVTRWRNEPLS